MEASQEKGAMREHRPFQCERRGADYERLSITFDRNITPTETLASSEMVGPLGACALRVLPIC